MTGSTIVILHDAAASSGRADESDVLLEARHIEAVLQRLGFGTHIVPVSLDLAALAARLDELGPHVVFNLMESIGGNGRLISVVPTLLESLDKPFTGCTGHALALTSNKLRAKHMLEHAGIAVPPLFSADSSGEGPWIVKAVWEHASLGLDDESIIDAAAAVPGALERQRAQYGGQWFAERYIAGRELNVALIATEHGAKVLPIAEITFDTFPAGKPQIVGYAAKWQPASFEYRNTARRFGVEAPLRERVEAIALACWDLFELDGYARVDFRVDESGNASVLEVNANPCLSPDAGFAAALEHAGMEFATALSWLVQDALRRVPRVPGRGIGVFLRS